MAKQRQVTFDSMVELVDGFLREFEAETDRGTTVVASAYLDDLLAGMLRKYLVDEPKVVDDLLDFQGPLGTFSSRISLSYCLGLIRDDQFRDLNTVRKIRNDFAHAHQSRSFDDAPICDFCDNLSQIQRMQQLQDEMSPREQDVLIDRYKTRRQKFIGNTVHLAMGLMVRGAGLLHAQVGLAATSEGPNLTFEASGA
ncbi:MAG: MltR family transcriptional regulator [Phycisphaerales bacterium]